MFFTVVCICAVLLIIRIKYCQDSNRPPFAIYSAEEPDAKKAKGDEEEEDYNLADIAEGSVTSVRTRGSGW